MADAVCSMAASSMPNSAPIRYRFGTEIKITETQQTREENQLVTLPLTLRTFGFSPHVGREFERISNQSGSEESKLGGFKVQTLSKENQFLGSIPSFCFQGDTIFFAAGFSIFKAQPGRDGEGRKVQLYAGGKSPKNVNNFTHRLRTFFGRISDNSLDILNQSPQLVCGNKTLFVFDRANGRVFELSESGEIALIAGGGESPPVDGLNAKEASLPQPRWKFSGNSNGHLFLQGYNGKIYEIVDGKLKHFGCDVGAGTSLAGEHRCV
mgnify:CR=1 FL=1